MATLVSPGVDVQIIDESFYGGAGPGTVPLIVFASAANKASPSGTGVAPYSVPNQAGKLFLATSQRELIQNFGSPSFKSVQGTQVHGHELNEYGLHAAYQFLGVSNRAYVLRADIDLAQLEPSAAAPAGLPAVGTHWLDLSETTFGVFQSNGNANTGLAWLTQPVIVAAEGFVEMISQERDIPAASLGAEGDFSVVVTLSDNLVYEKIGGVWLHVGSTEWKAARQTTVLGTVANPTVLPTDEIRINGETISFASLAGTPTTAPVDLATAVSIIAEIAAASSGNLANVAAAVVSNRLQLRDTTGGDLVIEASGSTDVTAKFGIISKNGVRVYYTNGAQYPANSVAGDVWIKGSAPNRGANWTVKVWDSTGRWVKLNAPFYPYDSSLTDGNPAKDVTATQTFGVPAAGNVYVGFDATNGTQQLRRWNGLIWENLIYEAGTVPPTSAPVEGTMWYNADLRADFMVCDGTQWMGYRRRYPDTDPKGALIAGSAPKTQSDGTPLVDNDLWIDSSDEENYPMIYRYSANTLRWNLVDKTDQTTPFGIVFADARQNSGPTYSGLSGVYNFNSELAEDMAKSSFVDPDCVDPRAYPDGVLMFNTRYSTGNVKVWKPEFFNEGGFDANKDYTMDTYRVGNGAVSFPPLASAGRWVSDSGLRPDGAPHMLRKAQRVMVVRSMAEMIVANEDLRSELVYFNLLAAPGYPELMDEMVTLNTDQKEVAFIVGDTPARLKPVGTDVQNWSTNALNAASTGEEGLTVANPYVGVYYPWGLSTNLDGSEIMVPPSTIVLRTMAYNDQVAYQWYAPAGYRRGLVTNASSVGYLTSENEFKPVLLSPGQRDVLYSNKINPIAFIPNRGLVVYGQKTLNSLSTALDRVNVARLANYLKYNLDNLVKPFLFEQNDSQTRDSARVTVERFLNGLVGLSALEDYAVLCDTSNNTPERRERNELWIDIAIKPVHSIEFIYIPVRILNLGDELPQATV